MMASSSSSSGSPCAACKFLRRKCTQTCAFAPYFPPDQPSKFANVHRVFGASNVSKLLNELPTVHREDAVNSLAFEAEARLRDPVYGCVGRISTLEDRLRRLQEDLVAARKELVGYLAVAPPFLAQQVPPALAHHHNQQQHLLHPTFHGAASAAVVTRPQRRRPPQQQQRQHLLETVQLMNAAKEQELMRGYEHQQRRLDQQLARCAARGGGEEASTAGFGHFASAGVVTVPAPPSDLALVTQSFANNSLRVQQHKQQEDQQQRYHLHLHDHHQHLQQEEGHER